MTAENRNSGPRKNNHCYTTESKHASTATKRSSRINNTRAALGNSLLNRTRNNRGILGSGILCAVRSEAT
jgi:hypothetical protein